MNWLITINTPLQATENDLDRLVTSTRLVLTFQRFIVSSTREPEQLRVFEQSCRTRAF
jgi:hypothetical protein